PTVKSFRNPSSRIRGTFLPASRRSQIWRDKFAAATSRTADVGPMHRATQENSAYQSRSENAPNALTHRKKSRRDRTVAVLTGPMLPAESSPRPRLLPNAAWKYSHVRADNWHGRIWKCTARSLHSTSTES